MTPTPEADARSAHWQHHIDGWQASGLSAADYCRQHQLTYHCFLYWRRKFVSTTEQPMPAGSATQTQALSSFVAVSPQFVADATDTEESGAGVDLHLRLPNGLEIRNIYHHNLANVRSLLACLS